MSLFDFEPQPETRAEEVLTVSEVTRNIKVILESAFPVVWIEGEISNFKHHTSGHMYFSLKDESAQMPCVMWASRNAYLPFQPENGMRVIIKGRVTVYERRGQYQLDVLQINPAGVGALQLAFEQLKRRLADEGLFDEEAKQPIPLYPERIGIVTSRTGAAIRDLLSVIRRRWPGAEIILRPATVQGEGAAQEIAAAIDEFNEYGAVDVLIVGRGGGSLEDLWAFNEEVVARAIFRSRIPVISAVGHEIDFTIADFVADRRAPTPSAAGEMVVPDKQEVLASIGHQLARAYRLVSGHIRHSRERLRGLQQSYGLRQPLDLIRQYAQNIDDLQRRLEVSTQKITETNRMRLESAQKHLQALSYESILQRGFTITRDAATRQIIKRAVELHPESAVEIAFYDGEADAVVQRVHVQVREKGEV